MGEGNIGNTEIGGIGMEENISNNPLIERVRCNRKEKKKISVGGGGGGRPEVNSPNDRIEVDYNGDKESLPKWLIGTKKEFEEIKRDLR